MIKGTNVWMSDVTRWTLVISFNSKLQYQKKKKLIVKLVEGLTFMGFYVN